jgi:hypothetical protein
MEPAAHIMFIKTYEEVITVIQSVLMMLATVHELLDQFHSLLFNSQVYVTTVLLSYDTQCVQRSEYQTQPAKPTMCRGEIRGAEFQEGGR